MAILRANHRIMNLVEDSQYLFFLFGGVGIKSAWTKVLFSYGKSFCHALKQSLAKWPGIAGMKSLHL
jgi:hypothetical protein